MPTTEVKILSDAGGLLKVGGYGVLYGGADVVGDYFSPETDFWTEDASKNPPVLYQHGQDEAIKRTRVGRVTSVHADDVGLWVEAQLTASSKYLDAIRTLVNKGILGWSSGSVPHLVDRGPKEPNGRKQITSWPIFEFSLTPTPAEPRTIGVRALKAMGLEPTVEDEEEAKATLNAESRNSISSSNFAYIDSEGGRHLPIHDEAHVRNAMARFGQTHFESPAKKKTAARKILAKARSMGIDVADDSAIANAAKGVSLNDLPDEAFGYVEPGGIKEAGLTTPRQNRHFPHHDEDGAVDQAQLELSIVEAKGAGEMGEHALSHLLAHQAGREDAHTKFWAEESAAGQILVIANEMLDIADRVVRTQKSMDDLGYGKSALRIRPEPLQRLEELKARFEAVLAHAEQAESGDDGTARADYLRRRLALLDV